MIRNPSHNVVMIQERVVLLMDSIFYRDGLVAFSAGEACETCGAESPVTFLH